jgi:hypothetical protein
MTDIYDYGKQAGQWISGRGNSMHGVTDPKESAIHDPVPEYTDPHDDSVIDDIVMPDDLPVLMEPIPVQVVNPVRPRGRTKLRVLSPSVAADSDTARPTMILGQDETRLRATIAPKSDGSSLYVSHDASMRAVDAFEITWETPFVTESTDPVYALNSGTDFERISVAVDYTTE